VCDWFARAAGFASMADLPFIIASAHVEYKAPIPKSADVEVAMWVSRMGSKSWTFSYAVRDASTGVLFAQVETVQVAYDYAQRATMVIPAPVRCCWKGLDLADCAGPSPFSIRLHKCSALKHMALDSTGCSSSRSSRSSSS